MPGEYRQGSEDRRRWRQSQPSKLVRERERERERPSYHSNTLLCKEDSLSTKKRSKKRRQGTILAFNRDKKGGGKGSAEGFDEGEQGANISLLRRVLDGLGRVRREEEYSGKTDEANLLGKGSLISVRSELAHLHSRAPQRFRHLVERRLHPLHQHPSVELHKKGRRKERERE